LGIHRLIRCGGQTAADLHCIVFQCLWTKRTKPCKLNLCRVSLAEREGFEPITLTAYMSATLLSKFQIGNETVTIFNR